ncbi:MAG: hypothetical protein VXZ99_11075, partial [Pseudomonadota bacterium]|nr:hypothetical protein [Pseudomonadota bacterium]
LGQSKVKSYQISDSSLPNLAAIKKSLTKDWAILELEKPLGDKVDFLPLMPFGGRKLPNPTTERTNRTS